MAFKTSTVIHESRSGEAKPFGFPSAPILISIGSNDAQPPVHSDGRILPPKIVLSTLERAPPPCEHQ